ncbi:MAG: type I methionyl aminopeptidase [Chthoniobacterales bacterium]
MIPIKTAKEIDRMREAGRRAGEIIGQVSRLVQPGVTTGEIDVAAAELIAQHRCTSAFLGYRGFPGNICISLNEEVVHGIGGKRRIQYGDIVKLDIGVFYEGFVGDTATTVAAGAIDSKIQNLLEATEASLYLAIKQAVAGNRVGDISSAVEDEITAHGFSVVREFVGHGVGRKLHEEPQVPNYGRPRSGAKLKPGMTLAIEPMVNMGTSAVKILADGWTVVTADARPSSHFEHTVLITDGEPEILTWREKSPATAVSAQPVR